MQKSNKIPLTNLKLSTPAKVISISNPKPNVVEILKEKKITVGTLVEVKRVFDFDHSLQVKIAASKTETISKQLANMIFVSDVDV